MDSYQKIIREVIEKYILTEDLSSIGKYPNTLISLVNQLEQYDSSNEYDNVKKFLNDLVIYTVQICNAINRCVRANNLNEGLSDYGINVPTELGGDLWNDMKRSYYNTKGFLNSRFGASSSSGYAKASANPNAVKNEKLSILLSKLPQYQSSFAQVNGAYSLDSKTQIPRQILTQIAALNQDYTNTINAQGQNP